MTWTFWIGKDSLLDLSTYLRKEIYLKIKSYNESQQMKEKLRNALSSKDILILKGCNCSSYKIN